MARQAPVERRAGHRIARKILRPDPYKIPSTIRFLRLISVASRRTHRRPFAGDMVLLYLHGGGYFACSAETHRPITVTLRSMASMCLPRTIGSRPRIVFPRCRRCRLPSTVRFLAQAMRRRKSSLRVSLLEASCAFADACAREAGVASPRCGSALFSLDGPRRDGQFHSNQHNRCAMFDGAGVAFSARYYLGDTTLEILSRLLSTPISPACRRSLSTLARTKSFATTRRASPNAPALQAFALI